MLPQGRSPPDVRSRLSKLHDITSLTRELDRAVCRVEWWKDPSHKRIPTLTHVGFKDMGRTFFVDQDALCFEKRAHPRLRTLADIRVPNGRKVCKRSSATGSGRS